MDEDNEQGYVKVTWLRDGNTSYEIVGDIGPMHLFAASKLIDVEGSLMYGRQKAEAMRDAASQAIVTASKLPT